MHATDREIEQVAGVGGAAEEARRKAMAEQMDKWRAASEDANKHVAQIQMKMADEKRRDKLTDRQRERQLLNTS